MVAKAQGHHKLGLEPMVINGVIFGPYKWSKINAFSKDYTEPLPVEFWVTGPFFRRPSENRRFQLSGFHDSSSSPSFEISCYKLVQPFLSFFSMLG